MNDQILQGLLKQKTIRFAAITGKDLVAEAQRIHALSRTATAALGRELLMVAMMAGQLKNDTDSVSAILSGGGPVSRTLGERAPHAGDWRAVSPRYSRDSGLGDAWCLDAGTASDTSWGMDDADEYFSDDW